MKTIDKIIESQEAPKDKNVLWIKGDKLLSHVNGKWAPVGGSSASTKNQDKSVDIVENGVTEVTADSGYTGLGKVTINANVQGGESGGDTMEYINIEGYDNFAYPATLADYVKLVSEGKTLFMSSMEYSKDAYSSIAPLAIAINTKRRVNVILGRPDEGMYTYKEIVTMMGMGSVLDLPRITEEQFYTL